MRYALLSDIHANLPALEAVLADIDRRGDVDATYHLGDLVGYGPWPNETIEVLVRRGIGGVAGNYDSTTATDHPHCGCRVDSPHEEELAHQSYTWTRSHVSASTKRYLGGLPFRIDLRPLGGHAPGPRLILVHGAPTVNTLYWTEDRPDTFSTQMAEIAGARPGDAIAFGHTHQLWHREVGEIHFVNAGSVGRPKDGDPRAAYALVEIGAGPLRAEFVRVEYDVARAAEAVRASELPDDLAEFLRTGGRLAPR
jgi:predicted phosphodiesterase